MATQKDTVLISLILMIWLIGLLHAYFPLVDKGALSSSAMVVSHFVMYCRPRLKWCNVCSLGLPDYSVELCDLKSVLV